MQIWCVYAVSEYVKQFQNTHTRSSNTHGQTTMEIHSCVTLEALRLCLHHGTDSALHAICSICSESGPHAHFFPYRLLIFPSSSGVHSLSWGDAWRYHPAKSMRPKSSTQRSCQPGVGDLFSVLCSIRCDAGLELSTVNGASSVAEHGNLLM